jgi:kumamolisin
MRNGMKFAVAVGVGLSAFAFGQQGGHTQGNAAADTSAPTPQSGYVFVPESNQAVPGRVHTTYKLHSVDGNKPAGVKAPGELPMVASDVVKTTEEPETPQSLGCLYAKSPSSAGCVPNYSAGSGGPSAEGYGAIALVDAYDNPDAATDLQEFDSYWGLTAANFTKVYANGNGDCNTPAANASWSVESSLDIEAAHMMAPKAAVVLVEACSSSYTDMLYAEQVAFNYIVANYPAGGQVSNSWGGDEFSTQTSEDALFADFNYNYTSYATHILAFASAGDDGYGAQYPSTNPWLISAGGTSVLRNSSTLKFTSESCWSGSGGGPSSEETYVNTWGTGGNIGPWADFQYPIYGTKQARTTPDLSFDADPSSGLWIYSAYGLGGWGVVGGTSLASPALAGIVNRAGNKLGSIFINNLTDSGYFTPWENNLIYSQLASATDYKTNFYDVTTGSNGTSATKSYDTCTGVGSPRGLLGK